MTSAVAQTAPPLEIFCVDDGSTDGTLGVLRELETAHPNLVRVMTGPNAGAPAARNRGLAEATGDYIQFLDADDVLNPDKLERQTKLAAHPDGPADLVAGTSHGLLLGGSLREMKLGNSNPWLALLAGQLGITTSNLWRRQTVLHVGGWDESWRSSQEAELMSRMLQHGARVVYDVVPSATIYQREGSISHGAGFSHLMRHVRLRVDALDHMRREESLDQEQMQKATDTVFNLIRRVSLVDLERAVAMHNRVIPPAFVPTVSPGSVRSYVWLYRVLGFRGAEAVRAGVRRVRSVLGRADRKD